VADRPETAPRVLIGPGQVCTTLSGAPLAQAWDLGVRTWGHDPDAETMMLTGTYETTGEISRRLLDALPPALVLPAAAWDTPLIGLLADEIVKDEPGQELVLDRLLDLLLIGVVRTWCNRPDHRAPAGFGTQADPVVGRAVRLLHHNPAHPWTVATLAAELGVSRAALARRFHDVVGEPPMTFLTNWRLALAADLLAEPDATIGAVATQVGYGSAFALSAAFKRVRGVSPRAHRRALHLGSPTAAIDGRSA